MALDHPRYRGADRGGGYRREDLAVSYTSDWKPIVIAGFTCGRCGGNNMEYCDWESDEGVEDQHVKCNDCGNNYWIDETQEPT